jgi:hypothetical protein
MTWNCNTFLKLPLLLVCAAGVLSCNEDRQDLAPRESVSVSLAIRVGSDSPDVSKGDPSSITEMNETFRGMTEIMLIPFDVHGEIREGDKSNNAGFSLPDITSDYYETAYTGGSYAPGLILNNRSHLFPGSYVQLARETASALIYGKAPRIFRANETEERHLNGILEISGIEPEEGRQVVSNIRFSPVGIYPSTPPTAAYGIADILSEVASAASQTTTYAYYANGVWRNGSVSVIWNENCSDPRLKDYFKWFTNDGHISGGSGIAAEYLLSYLYRLLLDYSSYDETIYEHVSGGQHYNAMKEAGGTEALTYADLYNDMRDYLLDRFGQLVLDGKIQIEEGNHVKLTNSLQRVYPGNLGLPDGAAAILWNGIRFEVTDDTLDGVAPISTYCYPPDLRYYANSTFSTSTSDKEASYTSEKADWNAILADYRGAKSVYSDTRSVALDQPLNYSCAMLRATLRCASEEVGRGTQYPLTGVIIGGQRTLRFDFSPLSGKEYFLYDNCISGIYLTPDTSPVLQTLVSQTLPGENVYFCLEFRNDSGIAFSGADGRILPGCKFYLVGRIEPPEGESDASIFRRDCATNVNCLVTSLSEARNSIPDLEHPSLTLGVIVTMNWMQATSSYIVMY